MIRRMQGNIFDSDCDAWCVPVDCVGAMGKGIALEANKRFPKLYETYKTYCDFDIFHPGMVISETNKDLQNPKEFLLCAIKDHWKYPSTYEYIFLCLRNLRFEAKYKKYSSVAIPSLGCGNGGLDWAQVSPMIVSRLGEVLDIRFDVYGPLAR